MDNLLEIKLDPKKLQKARRKAGLTQVQVADLLKVTKGAVSQYETGESEPRGSTLLRLLIAYNIVPRAKLQKVYSLT